MLRILLFLSVVVYLDAATTTSLPKTSSQPACPVDFQCQRGECCRDSSGTIVSNQDLGGFGPPRPIFGGTNHYGGTCSTKKAQQGEICDSTCQCDAGLECYRPVSGICCPPMKCYDATWVQKQRDYWAKCMMDPHCGLPP